MQQGGRLPPAVRRGQRQDVVGSRRRRDGVGGRHDIWDTWDENTRNGASVKTIVTLLVLAWLAIGAFAAYQRGYF
jgi:hypothetical protein